MLTAIQEQANKLHSMVAEAKHLLSTRKPTPQMRNVASILQGYWSLAAVHGRPVDMSKADSAMERLRKLCR